MTRRRINAAIGVLRLGTPHAFWPFVAAGREMDRRCAGLPAGATLDRVPA
ncbi:MAG: hypothetical protein JNL87_15335 [Burkholderiaceae bacterium]|nr:hypothetical protein [Burkholderiaceae bacterium]